MFFNDKCLTEGRAINSANELKSFKDLQKVFNEATAAEARGDMKTANKKYKETKSVVKTLINDYDKMPEDDFWDKMLVIMNTGGYLRAFGILKNKHSSRDYVKHLRQLNLAYVDYKIKLTNGENVTEFKDYYMKAKGATLKYYITGKTSTYDEDTGKFVSNK